MIQDNYKIYYGDRFGQGTAINHLVENMMIISMDRKNTTGLLWYYHGGDVKIDSVIYTVADGFITLTDNDINYIYVNNSGVVSKSLVGYEGGIPIAQITTASGAITEYLDKRAWLGQNNLSGYLKLDQTTPQSVINGVPVFDLGIECNNLTDTQICYSDTNGKIVGEVALKWDYTNDRLKIGNPTASIGQFYAVNSASYTNIVAETNTDATSGHRFTGRKSRGTNASPTAISSGDNIAGLFASGHDGTDWATAASAGFTAAEAFTTSAHGTQFQILNIISGTTGTTSQPVRVNNAGNLVVGSTTEQTYKFAVVPTRQATAGSTVLIQDQTTTTGSTKVVIKSGAGQSTGTLQEWQNISAAVMGSISETELITPATLKIKNSAKINSFTNSGSQADGTLAYTLPSGYPAVTGYVLSSTDAGVMSWVAAGGAYTFTDSVYENAGTVTLLNDNAAPGNSYYYGTDTGGTKGWFALPSGSSPIVEDATPSFALRRLNESTVGNTRGNYAIDLQYEKSAATQIASAEHSMILGGKNNQNDNKRGVIVGGNTNYIGANTTLAGGIETTVGNSFIGAGYNNRISYYNNCDVITGGADNIISTNYDTYLGSSFHVISGGQSNEINPGALTWMIGNTICGGQVNKITGVNQSILGGGVFNELKSGASYSGIFCGWDNEINNAYGFIGGGYVNSITTGGTGYHTVCGGNSNLAGNGTACFIGGGYDNTATGMYNLIVGGYQNTIPGDNLSEYNCIVGGKTNSIANGGDYNFIGGGLSNTVNSNSAHYSAIPGGYLNSANASYSFACGSNAHADSNYCFVFADGNSTTSSRTNQALFGVQGGLYIAYNNSNWVDFYDDSMGNQITTSSGATLTTGGVWTDASSKELKIKIADVDNAEILQKVMSVPVQKYQYKKETDGVNHIGLYSEDFYQAFEVGNDKGLGATDLCGVLWSAVQELKKELDNLKKNNNLQ